MDMVQYARSQYELAVREKSLYAGWEVFEIWARGDVALDSIGPGAAEVVFRRAIEYLQRWLCDGPDYDEFMAEIMLEKLVELVPKLDGSILGRLAAAGIPTDMGKIQHALEVISIRRFWDSFQDEDGGAIDLAMVCKAVFVERSVDAAELDSSEQDLWSAAQQWVDSQVSQIRAGEYDAVSNICTLLSFGELTCEAFSLTNGQLRDWMELQAQGWWVQAQAGDGRAAMGVIIHCETVQNSYERTTGLPRNVARPQLHEITEQYARRLRQQIEAAERPQLARIPFEALRHLRTRAYAVRNAKTGDGEPLVDVSAWYMQPEEWHQFCDRYARAPHKT